jgi:hypothetical protein
MIDVARHDEYGRMPTQEEVDSVFHLTRVMYKAVFGLHYRRHEQKKSGELALFAIDRIDSFFGVLIFHRSVLCASNPPSST